MYIVASFEYSSRLELAISEIEQMGTPKQAILLLPLDKRTENSRLFDSTHYADGKSFVDFAAIIGAVSMLLGGIYGFVLPPGPILCAIIGLVAGLLLGYLADLWYTSRKRRSRKKPPTNRVEVFMMIKCSHEQTNRLKGLLWNNGALGIALYDNSPPTKAEMTEFAMPEHAPQMT